MALCAALICAGCATPGKSSGWFSRMEPIAQTNLLVYRMGTNLDVRLPLEGRDAYAHASWAAPGRGISEYQHRFAVLNLEEEKRSERRLTTSRTNRVAVRDFKAWQQLLERVFFEIAPAQPRHAILLLLPNHELVIFNDGAGSLRAVRLENKPADVTVDGTCNGADFAQRAADALEGGNRGSRGREERQFLFATGKSPSFVLLDTRERLIVFIDYPADPDAEVAPMSFAVRAFDSLVIRSLVVTAIKNPVTLVFRAFWHLGQSGAAAISSVAANPEGTNAVLSAGPGMDLAAWERDLDKLTPARRYKGKLDLLIDGEKFFPAFIQSLANATRSADLAVYIFDTDDYATHLADLLKGRSEQIRVRVLFDQIGSVFAAQHAPDSPMSAGFVRPAGIRPYLRQNSKVEVRATANPWLTVDHRKLFIFDRNEAYVGGMNIGRNYRYDWHDMMVRVRGPIVGRLERDYRLAWAHAGPFGDFAYAWAWLFDRANPRKNTVTNAIDLRPLRTATGKREIFRAQLEAIDRCQKYIFIETPYFDDDSSLRALIRARQRGVDVRVVLPARSDVGVMQVNNVLVADELVRNGIRVYAYPGMTHVKAAIYDGWACVGSANFDKMSLRVSQELDVAFSDPATVEGLREELFGKDFIRSREVTQPGTTGWFDLFVKAFTDQF